MCNNYKQQMCNISRMFCCWRRLLGSVAGKRDAMGLAAAAGPEITQELATLTKALAEATSIIQMKVGGKLVLVF